MSFPCPLCNARALVTRTHQGQGFVRRRLKCPDGHLFGTIEQTIPDHVRVPKEPTDEPAQAETTCN